MSTKVTGGVCITSLHIIVRLKIQPNAWTCWPALGLCAGGTSPQLRKISAVHWTSFADNIDESIIIIIIKKGRQCNAERE